MTKKFENRTEQEQLSWRKAIVSGPRDFANHCRHSATMNEITLKSYEPGMRKISLTKLLQARLALPLSAAKGAVDALLEGRMVKLSVPDGVDVKALAEEVRQLGAVCEIADRP